MAARTQSSKKCFQTGTGTNSAFYMYERRYATEPFTAVKPPAQSIGPSGGASRRRIIRYGKTWAWQVGVSDPLVKGAGPTFAPRRGVLRPGCIRGSLAGRATRTAQSAVLPRIATAPTVSRQSDLRLRAAARE